MSKPDAQDNEMRKFGLIFGGLVALIFGLLFPLLRHSTVPVWPWAAGIVFIVWALVIPSTLKPVYAVWMKIGKGLGWFNTRLILGLLFFVVFTPAGLGMRLFGRDALCRKRYNNLSTYRTKSVQIPASRMEVPF